MELRKERRKLFTILSKSIKQAKDENCNLKEKILSFSSAVENEVTLKTSMLTQALSASKQEVIDLKEDFERQQVLSYKTMTSIN